MRNVTMASASAVGNDIEIDGLKLYYTVSGQGKPLILMHGWGCSSDTVASIAEAAKSMYTVYNIDLPGFGNSSEPNGIWGVEDYASLIKQFCQINHITNPILAGHSFGGRLAILLASGMINTDSLILIDAAGIKPHRPIKYYLKVYSFKLLKLVYRLILGQKEAQKKISELRAKRGSADYANASEKMRAILSKVVNQDLTVRLPNISCPTLLIWGENDTATPLSDARLMEKLIPDAGLVSFPNCGHYSFLDNPFQFKAVLQSFLKSRL